MLFWFIGVSVVIVWSVFRDPAIDYRLVAIGSVVPDVIDIGFGGARVAHTLLASVTLLLLTVVVTRGRRPLRKRLLAIPIGTLCHLVLDGVWLRRRLFWWPAFGRSLAGKLPSLERPVVLVLVQEAAGLVALYWFWRQRTASSAA